MSTKMTDAQAQVPETGFDRPPIRGSGWRTSFRDLTHKFNDGTKAANVSPTNGHLPPELLDLVFRFLPRRYPSYGFQRSALQIESWGISRVCKSWYASATRAIYETTETSTFSSTVKLFKTLEKNVHLRPLVRTLLLPTKGKRCPLQVAKVHLQILNLLESLEEVRVAIPCTSKLEKDLPMELIKHGETLTALCVHRVGLNTMPTLQFFPVIAPNFQELRFLNLEGLRFDDRVLSTLPLPPPLLHLRVVAFTYWNAIEALDRWLVTCPNLTQLRFLKLILGNMSTLKVFSKRKITHLALLSCLYSPKPANEWRLALENVRHLECSTRIFPIAWTALPLVLDQLTLEVSRGHMSEDDALENMQSYLDVATINSLVLLVEEHNPWFLINQRALLRLCRGKTSNFKVVYLPCQCSGEKSLFSSFPLRRLSHNSLVSLPNTATVPFKGIMEGDREQIQGAHR
ncbi:hypothetical protein FRC19_009529 [Serendipita sp. 401]|nr:hypothetical protein FRC19_009529 [Serendipita sp. 401]